MADSISDDVELLAADPEVVNDDKLEKEDQIVEVEDEPEVSETDSEDEPEADLETTDENKSDKFPLSTRPTITDISKAYPDFFKKFPSMKDVVFREREFTTIFPTINEAKEAVESSEALSDFREDLFQGNGEKFTAALKDAGELAKFSSNFLANLQKTNREAYWETLTPTFENLVRAFYREGGQRNDDSLKASAENLSIYLFGTSEVAEGKKSFVKETAKSDPKVEREKADWERQKLNDFTINVTEGCFNGISTEIKIDNANLTKTMRELLTDKIIKEVDTLISKDATHMKYVNGLWNKAKGNYSNEIKSRIISAYLERAKSLVPSIRRRLLTEALGSTPAESKRKLEITETTQARKEPGSQGKVSGNSVKVHSAKTVDWGKTSDMDFLNGNTTLKGRK